MRRPASCNACSRSKGSGRFRRLARTASRCIWRYRPHRQYPAPPKSNRPVTGFDLFGQCTRSSPPSADFPSRTEGLRVSIRIAGLLHGGLNSQPPHAYASPLWSAGVIQARPKAVRAILNPVLAITTPRRSFGFPQKQDAPPRLILLIRWPFPLWRSIQGSLPQTAPLQLYCRSMTWADDPSVPYRPRPVPSDRSSLSINMSRSA